MESFQSNPYLFKNINKYQIRQSLNAGGFLKCVIVHKGNHELNLISKVDKKLLIYYI